jgi:hypothetical protein
MAYELDLENNDIVGQTFYQQLSEYPEILLKVREALQKYLGRFPNLRKSRISNVLRFLTQEDEESGYSPQAESDGLRRLSLLLTYIYHPKCKFLTIDEPELYLHPDMISFLLEEILFESKYGKQFVFATHSPEIIRVGNKDDFGYFYFVLKDKLRDSKIIQASQSGADELIDELSYYLDSNKRAFLFAPVTVLVEGISDEVVYSYIKLNKLASWNRRIFLMGTGGSGKVFKFWMLWRKLEKECRVILDSPKQGDEKEFDDVLGFFYKELGIDTSLSQTEKLAALEKDNIFIAPYTDVLVFKGKEVALKDFSGAAKSSSLDFSEHVALINKATFIKETKNTTLREDEKIWLNEIAKEFYGIINENDGDLIKSVAKLKSLHPNLAIDTSEPPYIVKIRFQVSDRRGLFVNFPIKTQDTKIGVEELNPN